MRNSFLLQKRTAGTKPWLKKAGLTTERPGFSETVSALPVLPDDVLMRSFQISFAGSSLKKKLCAPAVQAILQTDPAGFIRRENIIRRRKRSCKRRYIKNSHRKDDRMMRRLFSLVLCLCLFLGIASAEEEAGGNTVLLKVWNCSDLEIAYLKFSIYRDGELVSIVVSCPDEGEDFYRCPYTPESPDELDKLRIECAYGISDLSPEEAVLQVMTGNPAEEHQLPAPELTLRCGEIYSVLLVRNQDGYLLEKAADEWNDRGDAAALLGSDPVNQQAVLSDRVLEFLQHWSRDEYAEMLDMCTAEWKTGAEDPEESLLAILDERRPMTCKLGTVSGTEGDIFRTVTVKMDIRKTDKVKEHDYNFHIMLQKEEDGIWRVDPSSLLDSEIADAE